jgi:hypothetical protein
MKVENKIEIYEMSVKGEEVKLAGVGPGRKELIVKSHWNNTNKVILDFEGTQITVLADELNAAIRNATNWKPAWM